MKLWYPQSSFNLPCSAGSRRWYATSSWTSAAVGRLEWERRYSSFPGASSGRALEILAAAWLAVELAAIHNHLAAREHRARVAATFVSLEHGVIHAHVMCLRTDGVLGVGVPDDQIGVRSRRDFALLRIHPEDAGGRSRGQLHKPVQGQLARVHAVM